jgi:hypothetical protein
MNTAIYRTRTNIKLNVAMPIDDAINRSKNPISSGSLIGVLNLMMDRDPSNPNYKGS